MELEAAIVVSGPAIEEGLNRLTSVEPEMLWGGLSGGVAGKTQEQHETECGNSLERR
jgi:hypothetical protein